MLDLVGKLNTIKLLSVVPWGDIREIIAAVSFEIHTHNHLHLHFNTGNILGSSNVGPLQTACVLHIYLIRHNLNFPLT